MPTVFAVDEYEAQEYDAVLVQENAVVCLNADPGLVRVIPFQKVNHVDADPELHLSSSEVPDSFFGGAEYAFVDVSKFDRIERHLEDIEREQY
ncbi:hypothetical protein ZOD2009_13371 [Haladaptatus paucihalophilus DX253]|uniref:Uncharacterized protein n=1 Tax=Haladaptatus paucihalophilus DX253 TaxID=797209 RepID=E7QV38_HALPU|nr:hypothetical protein [Haladaptatus paucihalophilus]EFW91556.1 hypothetical protein ZOD2009_13371 [Haladaptatus paucihalophilus DX253]SHL24755.1 hypothetical protein SAMN05444342_3407 [Haladaptatus paucihalophilus DX253]